MIKLVIGIDLDDTLTETSKLANKILHENDKYKDLEDFHLLKHSEYQKFLKKHIKDIQENVELKEQAIEVLKWLKEKNFSIVIITARGSKGFDFLIPITVKYLISKKIPYDAIIFKQEKKGKACISHNVSLFIDDKENVLDEISEHGIKVLRMNNKNENSKYPSVKSWQDVKKYIQETFNLIVDEQ